MFETLGAPELLIIGVLLVVLFGAGKLSRLGHDLGTSVKEFRHAIRDDDEESANASAPAVSAVLAEPDQPASTTPDDLSLQRPPAIF